MLKYILISFLIITNAYAYTCEEMGYTQTIADCPDHGLKCPAEPEKMFCCDPCGNTGVFRYNKENCSPDDGLQLAGIKCGDYWSECRECTSEYKYNHDNCRSPKILAGVQCGNAYTGCVYPTGIGCIPTAGYIYYSDGSCHADYDDTKEAIGVIVDARNKIIVALDERSDIVYNTKLTNITNLTEFVDKNKAIMDMDGLSNTYITLAFAEETQQEYAAVRYCVNKTDGDKKWYIPALGQFTTLYNNLENVQLGLQNIPNSMPIKLSSYYSSTEGVSGYRAWRYNFQYASFGDENKYTNALTRCIAHF